LLADHGLVEARHHLLARLAGTKVMNSKVAH
jgi:hypothetical protein